LARINQILNQIEGTLKPEQLAQLFYERAVMHDSLGLDGLAQYDFNSALKLNPKMAEAHNYIGILYTQQKDFIQAYESFDATLDINPEYDYAFLNRGIALYYGGRVKLALNDLNTFYNLDKSDPYRLLWNYIVQREVDEQGALETLRASRGHIGEGEWARDLVDLYLGDISEKTFLAGLLSGVENERQLTDKLCEAYFYLGKYHSQNGRQGLAANYFKLALSTNVYQFVEHRYARLELSLMRERIR
jgi:lipoprotein NlpI